MAKDPFPADVFALLEDECARNILKATNEQPMSVSSLVEVCDTSRATVYRRVDELEEHSFLVQEMEPDENGHHRRVYSAALGRLTVELTDGEFRVRLEDDPAEKLVRFWEEL